ncbi:MAG: HAD hydrolase-like protein, partial [Terracoccus sp.]
ELSARLVAAGLDRGAAVLALGGEGVTLALRQAGLVPVPPGDARSSGAEVSAVLQGFGRGLTVADYEVAARHLATGCVWVATNDDATLPLEWGSGPGNGAYVDLLASAVGRRPDVVGKPHAPLYELSLRRLEVASDRALAVGDRLATDIAGAVRAGLPSAWVLTGVEAPSALLLWADAPAPTYVIGELRELLQPYVAPRRDSDAWVCGRARATFERGELQVSGTGTAIEVVRASLAAVAAVVARDDSVDRQQLVAAGRRIDSVFASETERDSPSPD